MKSASAPMFIVSPYGGICIIYYLSYYENVVNHFAANTATICDIDIVLLLSLSYTYYLRCKLFHGEVPDSTFKLKPTDEDWEIEELGKLLEIVVFELLEHNHIFR